SLGAASIDARILEAAHRLVKGVLVHGVTAEAELERARHGGIEVAWDVPMRLTWIVGVPRLAWPGVNLKCYVRTSEDGPAMQERSFFLAHRAIMHALPYLK